MRFGICTGPENYAAAAEAGFDYVEGSLSDIAAMPEAEFQRLLALAPTLAAPLLKCNGFMPGTVKVTGPNASPEEWRAYLEGALSRAHALGIETLVLGSGQARRVPDGFPHDQAWRQFADFLRLAGRFADKYDLDIVLEPLRRKECNIMNLVSEATLLSALVDHPRINVLGDTYHLACTHEPLSSLTFAGSRLHHMHISHTLDDYDTRLFPKPGDGTDYATLLRTLREMGYQGDVSVEAGYTDFAREAAAAAAYIKPLLEDMRA